jgi:hypothetical protein
MITYLILGVMSKGGQVICTMAEFVLSFVGWLWEGAATATSQL